MIKDAIEDNGRRKSDNEENNMKTKFVVRAAEKFTEGQAKDI
jgi:hypothetical protein